MNTKGHAVRWEDGLYYLSDLTVQVKDDFCAWLVRREIANAFRLLEANAALRTQRMILANPPVWTSMPDEDVATAIHTDAGALQLNRLLFGLSLEEMTDAELTRLITTKEADETSDYCVAMQMIRESSDPKAKAAGSGSPAATGGSGSTQPSATNHSAEDPTSTST